jgi:hypothetical protein
VARFCHDVPAPGQGMDAAVGCNAGWVACGPVCTNLANDTHNCGACGHDCRGGSCGAKGCGPAIFAAGQAGPGPVAVDGTSVFWAVGPSTNRPIVKCPATTCAGGPTSLAVGPPYAAGGLAVDATSAFWTTYAGVSGNATIQKCAVPGCGGTSVPLATGQGYATSLALDATNVYWADPFAHAIKACAKSGCNNTPTTLTTAETAFAQSVVAVGGNVFWTYTRGPLDSPPGVSTAAPSAAAPARPRTLPHPRTIRPS